MTGSPHQICPVIADPDRIVPIRVGLVRLAVAILCIAVIWLVLLPWIGRQPVVAEFISKQQRLGINPSALFYTELSISPEVADHIERLHDAHSAVFWGPSPLQSAP